MKMKNVSVFFTILALSGLILTSTAEASSRVRAYVTKRGTYVAPSYRSSPNHTKLDNYNTKGNYNLYTGKVGTRSYR